MRRTLTAAATTKMTPVPQIDFDFARAREENLFEDALRPYYEQSAPVKLAMGAGHFVATHKWTLKYLRSKIGPHPCDVEWGGEMDGARMTIDFSEYAEYLERVMDSAEPPDPILYMAQNDLPRPLMGDVEFPRVCVEAKLGAGKLYNTMLWIGPCGTQSRLHYDPMDNFLMQITGRKQVYLIDKEVHTTCLYVGAPYHRQYNVSAIRNVAQPDLEKYPRFAQVPEIWDTQLQPGDILFIPRKWWHSVQALEYSISVNAWWR